MKPANLRSRQWAKILAYAEEVREANHRPQRVIVDDEGYSHVRGGEYGNGDREQYGYTLEEAKRVRSLLRAEGVKVSVDEAEGHLACALVALDGGMRYSLAMSAAERKAKHRERLREAGLCTVCATTPARDAKTTCQRCNDEAADRVRIRRERKKAQAA